MILFLTYTQRIIDHFVESSHHYKDSLKRNYTHSTDSVKNRDLKEVLELYIPSGKHEKK